MNLGGGGHKHVIHNSHSTSCVTLGSYPTILCLSLPTCKVGAITNLHSECCDNTMTSYEESTWAPIILAVMVNTMSAVVCLL